MVPYIIANNKNNIDIKELIDIEVNRIIFININFILKLI
jgi:hypothetical protein